MSRITTSAIAGLAATGLTFGSLPAAQAAPLPALNGAEVGGGASTVDPVGWRGGYYGPRYGHGYGGYGYRRRNVAGALFAGAALGLIGGAIAASAAPRYGYYGGYGGYRSYGYGYAPAYYGGYPAYGYGGYGYPYGW